MRKAILLILFCFTVGFAAAQAVSTRNDYSGLWTARTTWNENWAGIANPNPLPAVPINIYGYVSLGTLGATADLNLPASTSSILTVYDTLRVHGNLVVGFGAQLTVETGAVLIVHGFYNQHNAAKLTNNGTIIVISDFTVGTNAGPTYNYGNIYVGGRLSAGARNLTPNPVKDISALATDSPVTDYFRKTNVINSHCAGDNNGTLTITLAAGEYVDHWEISTDYFKNDIQLVASTSASLTYTNLNRTTSYRVYYYDADMNKLVYSTGATIFITEPMKGGVISGQSEFCGSIPSASLSLSGQTGGVVRWEWSSDNFITAPQSVTTTDESITLTNLSSTTYVRALVGGCTEVYSETFIMYVRHAIAQGSFQGPAAVCSGTNSGTVNLENWVGTILRWESSIDGFKTHTNIANTTSSLAFSNLSQNTSYRVVIDNGSVCKESYTSAVEVQVLENLSESTLAISEIQAPQSGLIAHYPFIKNANDASGSGNHGIVVGATAAADRFGRANNAYAFDGVDDYITTTTKFPSPGPNTFSLSLWFKTTSTTGGKLLGGGALQTLGSHHYDRHLYLNNTGQLYFGVYLTELYPNGSKVVSTPASYNDGVWHHVTATLSAAGMKLYVDGVLQASDSRYTTAEDYEGFWRMGYDNLYGWPDHPTSLYFAGALDDVSIYNRELSLEEITQLLKVDDGPFCKGQNIQLMAAVVPGATYAWTGPAGFSSTIHNPLLTNILPEQAGAYSVSVKVGNCEYIGSTTVSVLRSGTITASQTEVCYGTNSGTLLLENYDGEIVRWESSTDNFSSNIVALANTTAELAFTNLTDTTSYRAVVKSVNCGEAYAAVATINVVPLSQGGTISGPASVCKDSNSGTLLLSGYVGSILSWEYSDDGFVAHSQSIAHTADTLSFSNLTANRWYRVLVKNDVCTSAYSAVFQVTVTEIAGGTLSGPERVCAGANSGTVSLSNHLGTIQRWEWSNDGFLNHVQTIAHTQASYTFTNITADTWYRAVLGNAECGETTSSVHLISTDAVSQGGTMSGPASVCKDSNSGTLLLSGYVGSILSWEYSDDGFVAHSQAIAHTADTLSFSKLAADRWYRVLVKNGVCDTAFSLPFKVTVTEIAGGSVSGPERVCESANTGVVQLNNYIGTIQRWEWSNDGFLNHVQTIAHTQASYTFNNLSGDTWFRAVVGNAECGEKASTAFVVRYDLLSLSGAITGTSSVCTGTNSGTLTLADHRGQVLRWEYSTDDFVSHVQEVANTSTIHTFSNLTVSRWYRVLVQNGSCAAVYSASFKITVAELAGGTLSGPSAVCQTENSGALSLGGYLGNIIRWESSTDNFSADVQPIAHTEASFTFSGLMADTWYRVVVGNAECGETFSTTWQVTVDLPSLGGDLAGSASFCSTQNSGTLQLQNQQGTILRWEASTDDFASDVQIITNSTTFHSFLNLLQTTSFRVVVQNASCAAAFSSVAKVAIEEPSQAGAVAGAATVCYGENSGSVLLESRVGQLLYWESSTDGFATVSKIEITSDELPYQNLTATTSYRAVVQNATCEPVYSQTATISVSEPTQGGYVAGSTTVIAGANSGELQLQAYSGQILYWEVSLDDFKDDITQITNTSSSLSYLNLSQTSWYRVVVQEGSCASVFSTPAKIGVNQAPLAQTDTLQVQERPFTASISVLLNDMDPDGDVLKVVPAEVQTAAGGYARIDESGILYYESPQEFYGYDSLEYVVCDNVLDASLCVTAKIILDLSFPVVVYQGVSPNGDGDNDLWYIGFIERYPDNMVQLYDRYGALVYEQQGYNNTDRSFTGKGNKGISIGGEELPEGTYFYKIVTSAKAPVLKGYIVLKK